MSFNGNQIREFINGVTLNFAGYLQDEFVRLYGNDNYLKGEAETAAADIAALQASAVSYSVGDIREHMDRRTISPMNPWLPLVTPDSVLDVANYVDFVPFLRAEKLWYDPHGGSETSSFSVTAWDITSNVFTLTLASNAENSAVLTALLADKVRHGSYTNWRTVTLTSAIGDIPAGTYALTEVSASGLTVKGAVTAVNNSGSGSWSIEFHPYRIAGSTTTARWFKCGENVIYTPGSDMIAGLRFDDRLQAHWHTWGLDGAQTDTGSNIFPVTGNSTDSNIFQARYYAEDTIIGGGTPRTGTTTRAAGFAVNKSIYTGSYVA